MTVEYWYIDYGAPFVFEDGQWRRILPSAAAFPLMTHPQPDTAERTRLAVQAIPFAMPEVVRIAHETEVDTSLTLPEKRDE